MGCSTATVTADPKFEILRIVVQWIAILVVNGLMAEERTTELTCQHESMLKHVR